MRCIINDVMARFFMGDKPLGQGAGEAPLDCYGRYFRDVEAGLEARVIDPLKLRERCQRYFGGWSRFNRSFQGVNDMIHRRIEASTSNGSRNPLSILLDTFTPQSVFDELRTLGAAGATSVHHLSWTCHLLASHPEVQEKLRREILEQIDPLQSTSTIPLSELDDMPYLSAVTQESMRLFPPAPFMFRSDCQSNIYVVLPIWAMQRHPNFWDEPESFLPQRWLERGKTYPSFIPFGSGPRFCIARRFSLIETKVILMKVLSSFCIELWTRKVPVPKVHIMTRPRKDIQLIFKPLSR